MWLPPRGHVRKMILPPIRPHAARCVLSRYSWKKDAASRVLTSDHAMKIRGQIEQPLRTPDYVWADYESIPT